MQLKDMTKGQIQALYFATQKQYEQAKSRHLDLNIARGKPSPEQLDCVEDIFSVLEKSEDCFDGAIDARNYGELSGLPCAKAYWADMLDCKPSEIFVGGPSSLTLMFDLISKAYTHGLLHSVRPWGKEKTVKFLCPAPGYDRHFRITESFGAELIFVPMTENGPDMDLVEKLVQDPEVKGIWCVPKFSNPQGITYSEETISRIAALVPAAPDFIVMWDNAYCVHEFACPYRPIADILSRCREKGSADMVFEFASTSKITFPGSGISCMATSEENLAYLSKLLSVQMISYDKLNQLRHVRYLKNKAHTLEIMRFHAEILKPKFDAVQKILKENIEPLGFASWSHPVGGYFICLDTMPGTAKRALSLCKEAGVTLTAAGATYPYGFDPADANIRIAPSYPKIRELEAAMQILCNCLTIAACEKLLGM